MPILVDTNVILRSLHPEHEHYALTHKALAKLRRYDTLCIAPQNLIEFWAVATRLRNANGLGMTNSAASTEIRRLRAFFRVLPPRIEVLDAWLRLVRDHGVIGKQTHDAHLVATMAVHSIPTILTFNVNDFARYPGITAIDPPSA